MSRLLGERVEFFFEGYSRGRHKSRSRLYLEVELAVLLPELTEDQLRVLRDLAQSLQGSTARPRSGQRLRSSEA